MSLFLEDEVWLDEFLFGEELESAGAPLDAGELQQRWCVPVVSAVWVMRRPAMVVWR